ncbi:uncharacterized protein LOC136038063 [Artemia franciscana]|uniref:Uncharacterized protein n=1 Tax=Artemia franciscana TaxID=6661 RepID=A0AA88L6E7_ARTSF|nr:hypothetical protein QYM36_005869 [Artemia franciscana]
MDITDETVERAIQEMETVCDHIRKEILELPCKGTSLISDSPSDLLKDFLFLENESIECSGLRNLSSHSAVVVMEILKRSKNGPIDSSISENIKMLKCNSKRFDEMISWKPSIKQESMTPEEKKRKNEESRAQELADLEKKLNLYQEHFSYVSTSICGVPPPGFLKFNSLLRELMQPRFTKGANPWVEIKSNWYGPFLDVLESSGLLKRHEDAYNVMLLDLTDGFGN